MHPLADKLRAAREHTRRLTDDLAGERELGPRLAIVNPPRWEVGHVGWFDFHRAREAIEIGARAAERAIDDIGEAVAALTPRPAAVPPAVK